MNTVHDNIPAVIKYDTVPDRLYKGAAQPDSFTYQERFSEDIAKFLGKGLNVDPRGSAIKGSILRNLKSEALQIDTASSVSRALSTEDILKKIGQKLFIDESDTYVKELYRKLDDIGKTLLLSCIETLEPREIIAILNGTYIEHSFKKGDFVQENCKDKSAFPDKRFYILDINREGSGSDVYPALYVDCAHPHAFQKVILKTVKRRREEEIPKDPEDPENTEKIKILKNLTDTEYFSRYGTLLHETDMAEVIYLHQNSWHPELTGFIRPVDIVSYKATDIRVHISETLPFAEDLKDLSLFIVYQEEKIKTYFDALTDESIDNGSFWQVFAQILLEINQLHIKKLVHRDLKPENIAFCMKEKDKDRGVILDLGSLRTFYEILKGEFHYYQKGAESEGKNISPDADLNTLEALVEDSDIEIFPNNSGVTPYYFGWKCAIEAQRGNLPPQSEDFYSLGIMLEVFNKYKPRSFPEEKQAILKKIIAGLTSHSAKDENHQFIHGTGENSLYSLMQGRKFMQKSGDEEKYVWSALEGIAHFILETYPEEKNDSNTLSNQEKATPLSTQRNPKASEIPLTKRSEAIGSTRPKTAALLHPNNDAEVITAKPHLDTSLAIIPPGPKTVRNGVREKILPIRPEEMDFSDLPNSKI